MTGYDAWKLATPPDGPDLPVEYVERLRCGGCGESYAVVTTYEWGEHGVIEECVSDEEIAEYTSAGCRCIYCAGWSDR